MALFPDDTCTIPLDTSADACVEAVAKILTAYAGHSVYAYERESTWHVGVDSQASFTIDPPGERATVETDTTISSTEITGDTIKKVIAAFTSRYAQDGGMIFGQIGFNYSAYINGVEFKPGSWPLVSLIVLRPQIRVQKGAVSLRSWTENDLQVIKRALSHPVPSFYTHGWPGESTNGEQYRDVVQKALGEISRGLYQKVIASRAVDLPYKVDMVGTLVCGRRANTPRRTFLVDHNGFSATGFSPELVMSFQDGKVTTEPLAGTRANVGTEKDRSRLRDNLLNDPKEVMEHIISVQEAVREMNQFCADGTVAVTDLMSVKQRGKMQHLASTVTGTLCPSNDEWDALNVLFPSITATGIPKIKAIEAISRLETRPRELYARAIVVFEGSKSVEASLVLRTVFQDSERSWLQAGAGIIALSNPDRELTETCEKLRSFAGFVMSTRDEGSSSGE
ncbi:salicylate synthetase, putative [Paecilomyces variotii No. 5]|uniref:Salicylate synthetase, putative n=1 Tax=Byssochlamys spectabilis (strain No. 5 / NBRC 109023) TaxID=1356009 RepID=V5FK57_BYSSN|nr:salicylate synthetase, putative [Paecilomyces variotii No. 5]